MAKLTDNIYTLVSSIIWLAVFVIFGIPLIALAVTVGLFSAWFLMAYMTTRIGWWSIQYSLLWSWRTVTFQPRHAQSVYPITNMHSPHLHRADLPRLPSVPTPFPQSARRVLTPHSRTASTSMHKNPSIQSFAGDNTDRDFEDTGGWAAPWEDDEALYMAKNSTLSQPSFSPLATTSTRHPGAGLPLSTTGASSRSRRSSLISQRSPTLLSRTPGFGKDGFTQAMRSGNATPDGYFSLSRSQSGASLDLFGMSSANRQSWMSRTGHSRVGSHDGGQQKTCY